MNYAAFCIRCGRNQRCNIRRSRTKATIKGVSFQYQETRAFCSVCNHEVYVPELNDENANARDEAFAQARKKGKLCES